MDPNSHKDKDPFLESLLDALREGGLVVFVGAGLSAPSGISAGHDLRRALNALRALDESQTRIAHGAFNDSFKRRSFMHVLNAHYENLDIPPTHRELCSLPLNCIVTTNYDHYLENACVSVHKRASRAVTPWDISTAYEEKPSEVTIVKLHGDASCPETLVFNKDDYFVHEPADMLLKAVRRRWASTVQLFVGFSEDSPILRELVKTLKRVDSKANVRRLFVFPEKVDNDPKERRRMDGEVRHYSNRELMELLRSLRTSLRRSENDLETNTPTARQALEYKAYISRLTRFGWTIHPRRHLDVREVFPRFSEVSICPVQHLIGVKNRNSSSEPIESTVWSSLPYILNTSKRTLVIGPPGSGKSTSLRLLANKLASSTEETLPLPVFVTARELQKLRDKTIHSIFDWVEKSSAIGGLSSSIHSLCSKGKVLLIIDGFDELSMRDLSETMLALRHFSSAYPASGWIGSCRTHGYQDLITSEAERVFSLCPLSVQDITRFANCWISDSKRAFEFTQMIQSSPAAAFLASRPLFLSLLAQLWENNNHIPVTPLRLYDAAVEMLLSKWDVERAVFREGSYDSITKKNFLWRWALMCGRTDSYSHRINDFHKSDECASEFTKLRLAELAQLCLEIESSTGLLTQEGDHWTFSHRTFADFFAAQALLHLPLGEVENSILNSQNKDSWRAILELAACERADKHAQNRLNMLVKRCGHMLAEFMTHLIWSSDEKQLPKPRIKNKK